MRAGDDAGPGLVRTRVAIRHGSAGDLRRPSATASLRRAATGCNLGRHPPGPQAEPQGEHPAQPEPAGQGRPTRGRCGTRPTSWTPRPWTDSSNSISAVRSTTAPPCTTRTPTPTPGPGSWCAPPCPTSRGRGMASIFELRLDGRIVAAQLALHGPGVSYVHATRFRPGGLVARAGHLPAGRTRASRDLARRLRRELLSGTERVEAAVERTAVDHPRVRLRLRAAVAEALAAYQTLSSLRASASAIRFVRQNRGSKRQNWPPRPFPPHSPRRGLGSRTGDPADCLKRPGGHRPTAGCRRPERRFGLLRSARRGSAPSGRRVALRVARGPQEPPFDERYETSAQASVATMFTGIHSQVPRRLPKRPGDEVLPEVDRVRPPAEGDEEPTPEHPAEHVGDPERVPRHQGGRQQPAGATGQRNPAVVGEGGGRGRARPTGRTTHRRAA